MCVVTAVINSQMYTNMSYQRKPIQASNISEHKRFDSKRKHCVNVIQHFRTNVTLNELDQNCELPEVDIDKFQNTCKITKPRHKKKTIKFSPVYGVTNSKSKFSISDSQIVKPLESKITSRCSPSSSLLSNKSIYSTLNKNRKIVTKHHEDIRSTKHCNSPVLSDSSTLSSSSTSILSLEEQMVSGANQIKYIQSVLLKNKQNSKKTANECSDVKETSKDNSNNLIKAKNNCKGSLQIDEIKKEIKNEQLKKSLLYGKSINPSLKNIQQKSLEIKNMNIVTQRKIITELKTEIAEYRNKGLYVFNVNLKNNYGTDRTSPDTSKSENSSNISTPKSNSSNTKNKPKSRRFSLPPQKPSQKVSRLLPYSPKELEDVKMEKYSCLTMPTKLDKWVVLPGDSGEGISALTTNTCMTEVYGYDNFWISTVQQ